jgi:hypothetical protein
VPKWPEWPRLADCSCSCSADAVVEETPLRRTRRRRWKTPSSFRRYEVGKLFLDRCCGYCRCYSLGCRSISNEQERYCNNSRLSFRSLTAMMRNNAIEGKKDDESLKMRGGKGKVVVVAVSPSALSTVGHHPTPSPAVRENSSWFGQMDHGFFRTEIVQ